MNVFDFIFCFPRQALGLAFICTGYVLNYVANACIRAGAWCWDVEVESE